MNRAAVPEFMDNSPSTEQSPDTMPKTKRAERPIPQYLYASASKWTLAEYEFHNVDDEVKPWRDMLSIKYSDKTLQEDKTLQKLLSHINKEARMVSENDIAEMEVSGLAINTYLAAFYTSMHEVIGDTTGGEFERNITDHTPSPKEVQRVKNTRVAKETVTTHANVVPKSSSLQSMSSVRSDKQRVQENYTKSAFFALLRYIKSICGQDFLALEMDHHEFVDNIQLKVQPKPVRVENDGCIRLRRSKSKIPLLNIECKSRAGSSSIEVYKSIFAKEFGKSLAIMLARLNATKGVQERPSHTVYTVGVHHGRAYLARVDFDAKYLQDCLNGTLDERRITVTRSEDNYRLDDVKELRELATMLYCLCRQFMSEINAGRQV